VSGRTPFDWIQRPGDPLWPYEARHGGLIFYLRNIGHEKGRPVYCVEVNTTTLGRLKVLCPAPLKRLRCMSKRAVYAEVRAYCRTLGTDFERIRQTVGP
jgi:hypothetical protein